MMLALHMWMPPNQNIYLINFFSIENPTGQDHDEEETKKKIAELVSSQDFFIEEGSIDFDNESEWSLDIPN